MSWSGVAWVRTRPLRNSVDDQPIDASPKSPLTHMETSFVGSVDGMFVMRLRPVFDENELPLANGDRRRHRF